FAADRFFRDILSWHGQGRVTGRVRQPNVVEDTISEELRKLATAIRQIADTIESDQEKIEYTAAAGRCVALAAAVQQWLAQELDDQVYWIEVAGENAKRITLA